jgi:hypothetical protein
LRRVSHDKGTIVAHKDRENTKTCKWDYLLWLRHRGISLKPLTTEKPERNVKPADRAFVLSAGLTKAEHIMAGLLDADPKRAHRDFYEAGVRKDAVVPGQSRSRPQIIDLEKHLASARAGHVEIGAARTVAAEESATLAKSLKDKEATLLFLRNWRHHVYLSPMSPVKPLRRTLLGATAH